MARRSALRLIFHGAIFMLIGMLVGFPGFAYGPPTRMDDEFRLFYRQTHLIPISTGVWMIANGAAIPFLALTDALATTMVWSLIVSGYSLLLAQSTWFAALRMGWTSTAARHGVQQSPLARVYEGALGVTALGALIGIVIIMIGAWSALRKIDHPARAIH